MRSRSLFANSFLNERGLGKRPIVGLQPYSRIPTKDHPRIDAFVEALRRDYDMIIFHHLETGLSKGPSVASTAGLPLGRSIALVSALDAMVCVDLGFLHAAAAFDIPAVAMFGPTDGRLFTLHHRHATVVWDKASFVCAPCWRNEDIPCQMTRQLGPSPCVSSLTVEAVRTAVASALAANAPRRPAPTANPAEELVQ